MSDLRQDNAQERVDTDRENAGLPTGTRPQSAEPLSPAVLNAMKESGFNVRTLGECADDDRDWQDK